MKIRHLPLLLLLVTAPLAGNTQQISPEGLMKHIRFLASDELAGRGNGTKGLETAADYIADQFKAAGLQPGGTKGSWFQPLEILTGLTVGDAAGKVRPNRRQLDSCFRDGKRSIAGRAFTKQ